MDLHTPHVEEDFIPRPEIIEKLDRFVRNKLLGQLREEEEWLRKHCKPLIEGGYRLDELVYIIRTDRYLSDGKPIRTLMPRKEINPLILLFRRKIRKMFPYRMPNGIAFSKHFLKY